MSDREHDNLADDEREAAAEAADPELTLAEKQYRLDRGEEPEGDAEAEAQEEATRAEAEVNRVDASRGDWEWELPSDPGWGTEGEEDLPEATDPITRLQRMVDQLSSRLTRTLTELDRANRRIDKLHELRVDVDFKLTEMNRRVDDAHGEARGAIQRARLAQDSQRDAYRDFTTKLSDLGQTLYETNVRIGSLTDTVGPAGEWRMSVADGLAEVGQLRHWFRQLEGKVQGQLAPDVATQIDVAFGRLSEITAQLRSLEQDVPPQLVGHGERLAALESAVGDLRVRVESSRTRAPAAVPPHYGELVVRVADVEHLMNQLTQRADAGTLEPAHYGDLLGRVIGIEGVVNAMGPQVDAAAASIVQHGNDLGLHHNRIHVLESRLPGQRNSEQVFEPELASRKMDSLARQIDILANAMTMPGELESSTIGRVVASLWTRANNADTRIEGLVDSLQRLDGRVQNMGQAHHGRLKDLEGDGTRISVLSYPERLQELERWVGDLQQQRQNHEERLDDSARGVKQLAEIQDTQHRQLMECTDRWLDLGDTVQGLQQRTTIAAMPDGELDQLMHRLDTQAGTLAMVAQEQGKHVEEIRTQGRRINHQADLINTIFRTGVADPDSGKYLPTVVAKVLDAHNALAQLQSWSEATNDRMNRLNSAIGEVSYRTIVPDPIDRADIGQLMVEVVHRLDGLDARTWQMLAADTGHEIPATIQLAESADEQSGPPGYPFQRQPDGSYVVAEHAAGLYEPEAVQDHDMPAPWLDVTYLGKFGERITERVPLAGLITLAQNIGQRIESVRSVPRGH